MRSFKVLRTPVAFTRLHLKLICGRVVCRDKVIDCRPKSAPLVGTVRHKQTNYQTMLQIFIVTQKVNPIKNNQ